MTVHEVRCWPEFFALVAAGKKTVEVRQNDRGYRAGDTIVLREFEPNGAGFSGARLGRRILEAHDLTPIGLAGYVALRLGDPE